MCTDRFSGSRGKRLFSPTKTALATAASIPSRLLPGLVPSCAEGGVLGILPGTIGLIQATEAVKLILGIGEPLVGRLLLYDALGMRFRELKLRRNPECPVCGDHPTITKLIDYQEFCGVPHQPQAPASSEGDIDPTEVKAKIDRHEPFTLIDVREPHEYQIGNIPYAKLIPLGDLPKRVNELNPRGRDRGALQERDAQRESRRFPEAGGIQEGPQHEGRNPGLER